MALEGEQRLAFTIPIFEPLPSQVRQHTTRTDSRATHLLPHDSPGHVFLAATSPVLLGPEGRLSRSAPVCLSPPLSRHVTSSPRARVHVQYVVRAVSDEWLHAEEELALSFAGLILPERMPPHTGERCCPPLAIRTATSLFPLYALPQHTCAP